MDDYNSSVIAEFRANQGQVTSGAPIVLVHHQGRRSGKNYLSPLVYLRDQSDATTIYVFASKGGSPQDSEWYRNLTAAGRARIEVGAESYDVEVVELEGEDRDRIYAEQAQRMPVFGEYAQKTEGQRLIPVLALTPRREP